MADLPVPPASSPVVAVTRTASNPSTRASAANDPTSKADEDPFQAVLAKELSQAPDDKTAARKGNSSSSAGTQAESLLESADEKALLIAASDLQAPVVAVVIPFVPPALAGVTTALSAGTGGSAAQTDISATRPGRSQLQSATDRLRMDSETTAAAADTALSGAKFAADFAAAGKIALAVAGDGRRETALEASLTEQNKPAPAAPAGIPIGIAAAERPATAPAVAAVDARVGERGWDQGLGDKLVWMAGKNHQVAQLHLNPPELGPLHIVLTLNNDQASAQFVSGHALVRDAIESAMPRLREMLADSGISLGNTSVSAEAFREQPQSQAQQDARNHARSQDFAVSGNGAVVRGMQPLQLARGLVDTFA